MRIHPILAALRRHKAGTILIALQIALTLAIVSNALFIIFARIEHTGRPTGIDEANILVVSSTHTGLKKQTTEQKMDLDASIRGDLSALREIPGIVDAYETNTFPISNINISIGVSLNPTAAPRAFVNYYDSDEHTLGTLGLGLVAGRNFNADEVQVQGEFDVMQPAVTIVSKALADKLFPQGDALGKPIYFTSATKPSTIVGIVQRLQGSSSYAWSDNFTWCTVMVPMRMLEPSRYYVTRVLPQSMAQAKEAIATSLLSQDPQRVLGSDEEPGVRTFAQIRSAAYRDDRSVARMMAAISIILLTVTTAGIVGLSSFWVGQRRRQIGVRRALGATQDSIVRYFLFENALISGAGVVAGCIFAFFVNYYLMKEFELARLSIAYIVLGSLLLLLIGQLAALAPALKAARIPPSEAIR